MRQANVRQHVKQVLWGRWGRRARGVGGRGNKPQPTRTECQSSRKVAHAATCGEGQIKGTAVPVRFRVTPPNEWV